MSVGAREKKLLFYSYVGEIYYSMRETLNLKCTIIFCDD